MSSTLADLEKTVRLLARDLEATLGAEHVRMVHQFAADAQRLDIDEYSQKCVDDVQQYLQEIEIDTTWPACTRHPNHPMVYESGSWWCPRDRVALVALGGLPPRRHSARASA